MPIPNPARPRGRDEVPEGSPFGVHNLPYGVFSHPPDRERRVGIRLEDGVIDAAGLARETGLGAVGLLEQPSLNAFMASGRQATEGFRGRLQELLVDPVKARLVAAHRFPLGDVELHLPFEVADYVDFYSSEQHATNLGRLFRPSSEPLTPNWKHIPIGYHGRSGTVVVSGTPVRRPAGLRRARPDEEPTFGPCLRLDVEVEVGFVVGVGSTAGSPVPVADFAEHVFGVCLLNDWSARDIQAFEYVPLGPFLGKSFATSISPWVVPLSALADARVVPPLRNPTPAAYLADGADDPWGLDISLELELNGSVVSRPPFAGMYWTPAQQLAHTTVNGAITRTGDLFASGTVSGPGDHEAGSLLELSWGGSDPIVLQDGTTRTFLEDGDTVRIRATAPGPGGQDIGFGEVAGQVVPTGKEG
ncbi:MAG: fumarylacetoacetase [Acidimicrobiales bacterium]